MLVGALSARHRVWFVRANDPIVGTPLGECPFGRQLRSRFCPRTFKALILQDFKQSTKEIIMTFKSKQSSKKDKLNPQINKRKKIKRSSPMKQIRTNVAGIDLGSRSHWVSAPDKEGNIVTREFGVFTSDLYECANWLKECGIESIAMESTGVYWMHIYWLLADKGFEVLLVDSRNVKNVSGRKKDDTDAEWIQQLHSFGLLRGAFIPDKAIKELRTYYRFREGLIRQSSETIQRMQKSLIQMNLRLDNVLSDISGETGMRIIKDILRGVRDPKELAKNRDPRCNSSEKVIEESLRGNYLEDQLFVLEQELELYEIYVQRVIVCEEKIQKLLAKFPTKESVESVTENSVNQKSKTKKISPSKARRSNKKHHEFVFDLREELIRITGVDLTLIPGVGISTAFTLVAEAGLDMSRWKNEKHFASWLGLTPNNRESGGKILGTRTKKTKGRAAAALRMGASSLHSERNQTALGVFYRKKRSHLGAPKAVTAGANKLAKMAYNSLSTGKNFVEPGIEKYMEQQKKRAIRSIKKTLKPWGLGITELKIA